MAQAGHGYYRDKHSYSGDFEASRSLRAGQYESHFALDSFS